MTKLRCGAKCSMSDPDFVPGAWTPICDNVNDVTACVFYKVPAEPAEPRQCSSCKYSFLYEATSAYGVPTHRECRRHHPPGFSGHLFALWPWVGDTTVCGEYEATRA